MTDVNNSNIENNNSLCSFCGRGKSEVDYIFSSSIFNNTYICNECVDACLEIEKAENAKVDGKQIDENQSKLPKPKEINAILDQYVIGQEQAKKILSVAVYNHYKRLSQQQDVTKNSKKEEVEIGKSNILLIGPTGSGKTLLAETLARLLDVPFAIADATTLTEAGYVGEDVENIIHKLMQKCDYDVEKAQRGIIYIDEIDKISRKADSASITRDVSGEGVQEALLKMIEGTIASIPQQGGRKHPSSDYYHVDTRNILFICGGAFSGLEKVIEARSSKGGIGFNAEVRSKSDNKKLSEIFHNVSPEDLVKFGLIPEFIGRLPMIAVLDELDEEALVKILVEPKNSLVKQYVRLFAMENVALEFQEEALIATANKALKRKTGARGLRSILEEVLLDVMYELPSQKDVTKVVIDKDVITAQNDPILFYRKNSKKVVGLNS